MAATLAITGSTGELGGRVARRLAARGVEQRLIVRDAGRAAGLEGAEVAVASSYRAEDEMRAALEGARTLYFVSGREEADRLEQHRTVVRAAKAAGVERIAYVSCLRAAEDHTFTLGRQHWATEQAIRGAGMAFTFLRSSLYMDFVPVFAGEDRVIRGPAGQGRYPPVTRDDLADCAVAVLTSGGARDGRTYELTGPELLTLAEIAERMSTYTGQEYRYEDETIEEAWASRRPSGAPDWEIEGWITTYTAIAAGDLEAVSDTVERFCDHEPRRLGDWLRENPEAWRHLVHTS